jgi:hypothetical protein
MYQNIYTGSNYVDDTEAHTDNGRVLMVWIRMQFKTARPSLIQNFNGFFLSTT